MHRSKKLIHHLKNLLKLDPDLIGVDTTSRSINNKLMGKSVYIPLAVVLIFISGVLGFIIGNKLLTSSNSKNSIQIQKNDEKPDSNSFFNSQTATSQGIVTKITGTTLTIKNSSNQTSDFPLAKNFAVYTYTDLSRVAALSTEIKSIQINRMASIIFNLIDNRYQITSITYLPK